MLGQSYAKVMMMSKTDKNWTLSSVKNPYLYFNDVTVVKLFHIDPSSSAIISVCYYNLIRILVYTEKESEHYQW